MTALAQITAPPSIEPRISVDVGTDIAASADTPAKTALVWIGGIVLLVAIFALVAKVKRDSE